MRGMITMLSHGGRYCRAQGNSAEQRLGLESHGVLLFYWCFIGDGEIKF
jgi:hypothetical protein